MEEAVKRQVWSIKKLGRSFARVQLYKIEDLLW